MRMAKRTRKDFWRLFFAWAFFAAALVGYGAIIYESAQDGSTSSDHSSNIGDLVPDDIVDDAYDDKNIINIKDFAVSFAPNKDQYFVGDVIEYSYSFTPENTSFKDIEINASPESLVSIHDGEIVCLKEGKATLDFISKKNDKLKKSISFDIKPVKGESISLGSDLELTIGDVRVLEPIITPNNVTYKDVEYSSSNDYVAEVTSSGTLKAKNFGEATIYASLKSDENIKDSIKVKVSEKISKETEVREISLPESLSIYAKEKKTVVGSFSPRAISNFSLDKLKLDSSDEDLIFGPVSYSLEKGTFSFPVSYECEDFDVQRKVNIKASYQGKDVLEDMMEIDVLPTEALTVSLINPNQKNSYSGSIYNFINYPSETLTDCITLKVDYLESKVVSQSQAYRTKDISWEVPSSLSLLSYSYDYAILEPTNNDHAIENAEVFFYPNSDKDERITYKVSYSFSEDDSRIEDVTPLHIYDGIELSSGTIFKDKLDCELVLNKKSDIISSSGYEAEIIENSDLAVLSKNKSDGSYTLETKDKEGQITIRFVSSLDPSVFKDININITKKPSGCMVTANGEEINGSLTLKKGEAASLSLSLSQKNEFKDSSYSLAFYSDSFSVSFSREGIASFDENSSCLLPYNGTDEEGISITITSDSYPALSCTFVLIVDYVAPNVDGFSLNLELISYPGEDDSNKPVSLNQISVGTKLKAYGKVDENASVSTGFYISSDQSVITIDSLSGKMEAVGAGFADIEFHSDDNPSLFVKESIEVKDSIGPISIDFESLGAIEYEIDESYDGKVANIVLAYGQSYKIKPILPSYATYKKVSYVQKDFMDQKKNEDVLEVNDNGIVTLKKIGKTFIYVTYGSEDTLATDVFVLSITVKRDIESFWSTFLYLVRKTLGHFGVFMLSAICTMVFVALYFKKEWLWLIGTGVSLLVGFVFTGISELIQLHTPGRYGCWADVWIDFKGTLAGVGIISFILLTIYLIKIVYHRCLENKKNKEGRKANEEKQVEERDK